MKFSNLEHQAADSCELAIDKVGRFLLNCVSNPESIEKRSMPIDEVDESAWLNGVHGYRSMRRNGYSHSVKSMKMKPNKLAISVVPPAHCDEHLSCN